MLDEELTEALSADLPDVPHVFISSFTSLNLQKLKDLLWAELNKDGEYIKAADNVIVHRKLDIKAIELDEDEEFDFEDEEDDYEEEWDEDEDPDFDADFYYREGEEDDTVK